MILTDDKLVEALEARRVVEDQNIDEPPPTYASLSVGSSSSPEHTDQAPRGVTSKPNEPTYAYPVEFMGIKPTNYISISRVHNSIKETFLLDPGLYIPPSVRPSPEREENLRLESTHGAVYADVGIVPGSKGSTSRGRAKLWMKSTHGGVTAKIRTPSDPNLNLPPTSFHLTVQSTYGDVRVHLPRTFHGPLVLKVTHGSIKFSDALSGNLTTFGEVDGTRRCFVGDFSGWRGGAWKGDEVVVEASHGSVKVVWEDDCVVGAGSGRGRTGFLNKVFGF